MAIAQSFGLNEQTGQTLLAEIEAYTRMQLLDVFVLNTQAAKEVLELFYSQPEGGASAYHALSFLDLPKKWNLIEEVENTLFCLSQEKCHTVVSRGIRNIYEAP